MTSLPNQTTTLVTRAMRWALVPWVRLCVAHGIQYGALSELLKGVFVEVADKDFALEPHRQTDSRVHVLTGVHRKDVRRLRSATEQVGVVPASISLGVALVTRWTSTPPYTAGGQVRALARLKSAGGDLSFEALVASISKDVRPRALLDEWLRLGLVTLTPDDYVCLNQEAFVPRQGLDELAYFLGHNLYDHAAAAVDNVLTTQAPRFERAVRYEGLSPESIAELKRLAAEYGMSALKAVNERAAALEERDRGQGTATERFTFGAYIYDAPRDNTSTHHLITSTAETQT